MNVYLVGGYVRDKLLAEIRGFPFEHSDRDWVVVGETPERMLAAGYLPVGNDFPVFLHPKTHEEYALARTERKTAPGYHGFVFHAAPDVTLEEDLRRRDLTVNAMALSKSGELIDPYGGLEDLRSGVLRHVSEAFEEDPVRILRVARFSARFPDFRIAPETMALMHRMVDSGEADALVAERVGAEFSKGLAARSPQRMIDVLFECGLWTRRSPDVSFGERARGMLERTLKRGAPIESRLCALLVDAVSDDAALGFLKGMRASATATELFKTFAAARPLFGSTLDPENAAQLFERIDAVRRPERARELLRLRKDLLCSEGRRSVPSTERLLRMLDLWTNVDAGAVARAQTDKRLIGEAVAKARRTALEAAFSEDDAADQQCNNRQEERAHEGQLDLASHDGEVEIARKPSQTEAVEKGHASEHDEKKDEKH